VVRDCNAFLHDPADDIAVAVAAPEHGAKRGASLMVQDRDADSHKACD
jgi:hypothetical protein